MRNKDTGKSEVRMRKAEARQLDVGANLPSLREGPGEGVGASQFPRLIWIAPY